RYACKVCRKAFNRPSSLRLHMTTHTGEKPYSCIWPGCNRSFSVPSNARRHQRRHMT
ncbi:hypothetical protein DM01DRAFT_1259072, partial [Hesseltinella vesiculosa]